MALRVAAQIPPETASIFPTTQWATRVGGGCRTAKVALPNRSGSFLTPTGAGAAGCIRNQIFVEAHPSAVGNMYSCSAPRWQRYTVFAVSRGVAT